MLGLYAWPARRSGTRSRGLKRGVEVIVDHQGLAVRLTDERLAHILDHPEMVRLGAAVSETLKGPSLVFSRSATKLPACTIASIQGTPVGDKFVCVVVKAKLGDAFVLTAYLTDKPKKGTVLWSASK